jgi:hypothetical protein
MVTSPSAIVYQQSTSNQSASGFSVEGFNSTATLLVTIGLVNPPIGTTLRLGSTSGITASTGYSLTANFTRISFTGNQNNINSVLSSLLINTGSIPGNVYIAVTATVNPAGYFYLPSNGHFYRPMSWPSGVSGGDAAYLEIKSNAASQTFKGQAGYLVTITSQDEQNFIQANVPGNNILIALTDRQQEGVWKWDAGPEDGTIIKTANFGGNVLGQYNNWCSGEPNNWGAGENYTVTKWGGGNCWNDFGPPASSFPGSVSGYVVEFGTWADPANQTFTDFYTGLVTHQITCSTDQTPNAPTEVNGSRAGAGIVSISATVSPGVTVDWYSNLTGGNPFLVNSTTYTTSNISTTTSYYAQARNITTGCISSTRTEVKAIIVLPILFSYTCTVLDWDDLPISGVSGKLYTKIKGSADYSLYQAYLTDSNGKFAISTTLDTAFYDFQIVIGEVPIQQPTVSDAEFFNRKILFDSIEARDYYRMNTNGNSYLTISDVYLIYQRTHGTEWPTGVLPYRLFTQSERVTVSASTSNLLALYPGQETIILTNLIAAGESSFYLITTGVKK